ncbi:MAG TPA: hypothetical protein VF407_12470 [Polyangiaceae bacterium]
MLSLSKASLLALGLVVGTVGFAGMGCSSAPAEDAEGDTGSAADDIDTTTIVARAQAWSSAKLKYCQAPNGGRDYDSACSTYCNRKDNKEWDPYRSDCSGLVSWAWGLPAPGRVTSQFAPYKTDISSRINGNDLRPGDALNLIPNSEHIILFVKWVTKGKRATFIEEPGCSLAIDYAHTFDSNVSISGSSVYVSYEGSTFAAIRYKKSTLPDALAKGYLDAASCTTISGWSEDPDTASKPVNVDLTFDAPEGKTGSGMIKVSANAKRDDLCKSLGSCNHGYSVAMPTGVKDGKKHTVYAYGHDLQGNAAHILTNAPKSFTCAPPALPTGIKRHVVSTASMKSWKFDPLLDVAHEPKASVDALTAGPDLEAAPTVVQAKGDPAVYVIEGTTKRHVLSQKAMVAWGFTAATIDATKLAGYTAGQDWPNAPFVVQGEGEAAVYVMDAVPPDTEGTVGGNGTDTNGDETDTPDQGATASDDGKTDDPATGQPNEDAPASAGESSGCSVGTAPGSSSSAPFALLAGLGLVLAARAKKKSGKKD